MFAHNGPYGGALLIGRILRVTHQGAARGTKCDYCAPAAGADTRRQLRSSNCQLLPVPCYRLNTYGCRAFSVAGPTVWNSLPDFIRDPTISADFFRRLLKTYLFARY